MDLVTLVVGLPLAPVRGLVALAELLRQEAERELYDPARLRRQLEETEAAVAAGQLSKEEGERKQQGILSHLAVPPVEDAPESQQPAEEPERR